MMLATLVDTAAIWRIVLCVFAVGAGATTLFGAGVRSLERLTAEDRAEGRAATAGHALVVLAAALVCAALLVVGVVAMTHQ